MALDKHPMNMPTSALVEELITYAMMKSMVLHVTFSRYTLYTNRHDDVANELNARIPSAKEAFGNGN